MNYTHCFYYRFSYKIYLKIILFILLAVVIFPCYAGWVKSYSPGSDNSLIGSTDYDNPMLALTSDGGYITAGIYHSNVSGQEDRGKSIWVLKLSATGEIQWQRRYRSAQAAYHKTMIKAVHQTQDQGYILAGSTHVSGRGREAWVIKLDSGGDVVWDKAYGGALSEGANDIVQTTDGGYLAIGWSETFSESLNQSGPGGLVMHTFPDAWVFKLDSVGNIQWQRTYGGDETECCHDGPNTALKIIKAVDDGYILRFSYFLVKIDTAGDVLWRKRVLLRVDNLGGYGGGFLIRAIQQTTDNGFVAIGFIFEHIPNSSGPGHSNRDQIAIAKLNADGDLEWYKAYSYSTVLWSHYRAFSVKQTDDSGYLLTGYSYYSGQTLGLLLKFSADGQLEWQSQYGGAGVDRLYETKIPTGGGLIVFGGTTSFGGEDSGNLLLLRLSSNGSLGFVFPRCRAIKGSQIQERAFTITDGFLNNAGSYYIESINATAINSGIVAENINITSQMNCGFMRMCCFEANWQFSLNQVRNVSNISKYSDYLISGEKSGKSFEKFAGSIFQRINAFQADLSANYTDKRTEQRLRDKLIITPVGRYFNKELKSSVINSISQKLRSKASRAKLSGQLIGVMNAIELDFRVPYIKPKSVKPGKYSTIDMHDVARVSLSNVVTKGKLSLNIKSGLPANIDGYKPGWPVITYDFGFTGSQKQGSHIDFELFVGVTHANNEGHNLRVLQWDGIESFSDITSRYNPQTKVISGRTNKLSYIFVVEKSDIQPSINVESSENTFSGLRIFIGLFIIIVMILLARKFMFK